MTTTTTTDGLRAVAKRLHDEAVDDLDGDRAAAEFGDQLGSLIDLVAKLIDDGEVLDHGRLLGDRRTLLGAVRRLAQATEELYGQDGGQPA